MIIIKINNTLIIHSAVCLNDDTMQDLFKLGNPEVMIIPVIYYQLFIYGIFFIRVNITSQMQ